MPCRVCWRARCSTGGLPPAEGSPWVPPPAGWQSDPAQTVDTGEGRTAPGYSCCLLVLSVCCDECIQNVYCMCQPQSSSKEPSQRCCFAAIAAVYATAVMFLTRLPLSICADILVRKHQPSKTHTFILHHALQAQGPCRRRLSAWARRTMRAAPMWPLYALTLQLPLEGKLQRGGVVGVIRTADDRWLHAQLQGSFPDFYISTREAGVLLPCQHDYPAHLQYAQCHIRQLTVLHILKSDQAGDHAERLANPAEGGGTSDGTMDPALPPQQEMAEAVASLGAHPAEQLTALLGRLWRIWVRGGRDLCTSDVCWAQSNMPHAH